LRFRSSHVSQFIVQHAPDSYKLPPLLTLEDESSKRGETLSSAAGFQKEILEKGADISDGGCRTPTSGAQASFKAEDKHDVMLETGDKETHDQVAENKHNTGVYTGALLRSVIRRGQAQAMQEGLRSFPEQRSVQRQQIQRMMEVAHELIRSLDEADAEDSDEVNRQMESLQDHFSQLFDDDVDLRRSLAREESDLRATPPLALESAESEMREPDAAADEKHVKDTRVSSKPAAHIHGYSKLSLRCFAPDQSPIQGREYIVDVAGATIGRKNTNTIHFCHTIDDRSYGVDK
jgi:hypothetical protein